MEEQKNENMKKNDKVKSIILKKGNPKKFLGVLMAFIGNLAWGWVIGLIFSKNSYERKTFYKGYWSVFASFAIVIFIFLIIGLFL